MLVAPARAFFRCQANKSVGCQVVAPARAFFLCAVRGSPEQKSAGLTAGKLLNRFIKNKTEVLRFMTDFAVPFDNNGSERDLRMLKLQQKIAGCFRTTEGVQTFCRVRSYLSSAKKQSKNLLVALEHALKGKPTALAG